MSKTTITYTCGHSDTIQVYGPYKGRDAIAAREARKLCPACYQAKLAADRAAESAAAAEQAQAAGLPALTGSPKQIAWAESIRAKQVAQLQALDAKLAVAPATANTEAVRIGREIIASMIARTDAKAWIDGRDTACDSYWLSAQVKSMMQA